MSAADRPEAPGPSPRGRARHIQHGPLPADPIPATSAWRPGDPAGHRQFAAVGQLPTEAGSVIPDVTVAYETWGTLNSARDNAILVLHALTGDSHVTGAAGVGHRTAGWWNDIVGPGKAIDTDRYFVVAPNALGGCQGSTGPASSAPDGRPWGSRFPHITVRDQVAAEIALSQVLGLSQWHMVIGASMGGSRALEWAAMGPLAGVGVRTLAVVASGPQTTADQIAWAHPQIAAIRNDAGFCGGDYYDQPAGAGPHRGLALARQIAHTTYRSASELDVRFGRVPQGAEEPLLGGRFAVQSYLDYHGDKLARRFDANSYLVLTEAMLTHDLGRDRGGARTALQSLTMPALVVAVDSDRLFRLEDCARMARDLPGCDGLDVIRSLHGHDGFLVEHDQLDGMIRRFLDHHRVRHIQERADGR